MAEPTPSLPPQRPPSRLTEFLWAVAANTLGTLLAGVIGFTYAKAAGLFKGAEVDWVSVAVLTVAWSFSAVIAYPVVKRFLEHRRALLKRRARQDGDGV
jgi:hypothetical protein